MSTETLRVLRPRRLLVLSAVCSVVLVVGSLAAWFGTPEGFRTQFSGPQVATLVLFVAVMVWVLLALGLAQVRIEADGIRVRNLMRTSVHPWSAVRSIRLRDGDPWAHLVLHPGPDREPDDPQLVAMLALARTEGERTRRGVLALRQALQRSRA